MYCGWFRSYLIVRTQALQKDDTVSEFLPTSSGVLQGSCLGLVLFIIYTNDLPQHINGKVVMYADDTQILASSQLDIPLATMLQSDLMALDAWALDSKEPADNKYGKNSEYSLWIMVAAEKSSCWHCRQPTKRTNKPYADEWSQKSGVVMDTRLL